MASVTNIEPGSGGGGGSSTSNQNDHYFTRAIIYVPVAFNYSKPNVDAYTVDVYGYYDLSKYYAASNQSGWKAPSATVSIDHLPSGISGGGGYGYYYKREWTVWQDYGVEPNYLKDTTKAISTNARQFQVSGRLIRYDDPDGPVTVDEAWGGGIGIYTQYFAIEVSIPQGYFYENNINMEDYIWPQNPTYNPYLYSGGAGAVEYMNQQILSANDSWEVTNTTNNFRKNNISSIFPDISTIPLIRFRDTYDDLPVNPSVLGGLWQLGFQNFTSNIQGELYWDDTEDVLKVKYNWEGTTVITYFDKACFNGVKPKRLIVFCQGAGGGGAGTKATHNGSGGGAGATALMVLRLPNPIEGSNGKWYFQVGAGGKYGQGSSSNSGAGKAGGDTGFWTLDPSKSWSTANFKFFGAGGGSGASGNGGAGGAGGICYGWPDMWTEETRPAWLIQGYAGGKGANQKDGGGAGRGESKDAQIWYGTKSVYSQQDPFRRFKTGHHSGGWSGYGGGGGASYCGAGGSAGYDGAWNGECLGKAGQIGAGGGGARFYMGQYPHGGNGGDGGIGFSF